MGNCLDQPSKPAQKGSQFPRFHRKVSVINKREQSTHESYPSIEDVLMDNRYRNLRNKPIPT